MKTLTAIAVLCVMGVPIYSNAQPMNRLEIGKVVLLPSTKPVYWGIGGIPIIYIRACAGKLTPITRAEIYDARAVDILSKCVDNPLQPQDVKVLNWKDEYFITVRGDFLAEVLPQDAAATGMKQSELANEWAKSIRDALMKLEPIQNKKGI
jgi:hypothetical protein